jgi:hypothetical protein
VAIAPRRSGTRPRPPRVSARSALDVCDVLAEVLLDEAVDVCECEETVLDAPVPLRRIALRCEVDVSHGVAIGIKTEEAWEGAAVLSRMNGRGNLGCQEEGRTRPRCDAEQGGGLGSPGSRRGFQGTSHWR